MTRSASHRLCRHAAACATALGLMLAAAGAASAFSLQNAPGSGDGQGFTDLDVSKAPQTEGQDPRYNFNGGGTTYKYGNTTLQFGGQQGSLRRNYDPSNLFDPFAREGRY